VLVVTQALTVASCVKLRHPNVLQFKDSVEVEATDKGGPVTLFLVTEAVQPLSTLLTELQLGGSQRCFSFEAQSDATSRRRLPVLTRGVQG